MILKGNSPAIHKLGDIKELEDIFELLFYLGQSDSDEFLNDE